MRRNFFSGSNVLYLGTVFISPISQASKRTGLYPVRSEEHTSELQSRSDLVCRLLLEKKKTEMKLARLRVVLVRLQKGMHYHALRLLRKAKATDVAVVTLRLPSHTPPTHDTADAPPPR